jgi:hypothetical protein
MPRSPPSWIDIRGVLPVYSEEIVHGNFTQVNIKSFVASLSERCQSWFEIDSPPFATVINSKGYPPDLALPPKNLRL